LATLAASPLSGRSTGSFSLHQVTGAEMRAGDHDLECPSFDAMELIVNETLGPDHACTRAFAKARSSCTLADIEAAVDGIFALHPFYRDCILARLTSSLPHDSQLLEWLVRRAPSSDARH